MVFWITIIVVVCLAIGLLLRWNDRRNSVEVFTPQDGARELAKLKPYFSREVVERKVRSLFPDQDHAQILQLLDDYTPDFWGLERMQLNILKLSNGNLEQLHHYLKVANSQTEFIKVIQMAESPESSRIVDQKEIGWGKHKKLVKKDYRDYLNWLKKK